MDDSTHAWRTRVLHVITDDDRRGAQVFAVDLDRAMRPMPDISSSVVALANGRVGGLDIECLGERRLGLATIRALRQRMRAADIVVAHGSSTLPACAIAGSFIDRPFVTRQISETGFWVNSATRRARVRLYLARARHVVALAPSAASDLNNQLHVARDKITVIPNGVPGDAFAPATPRERTAAKRRFGLDPEKTTLVVLGALVPEKGVDMAIRAVAATNAQMLIVGEGPQRSDLERLAERVAPARVRFAGSIPDPNSAFAAADLLVLASKGGDSMPAVIIEAGFCGVPTVATAVGAIQDTIVNNETGLVVNRSDQGALNDAVLSLIEDGAMRTAMGDAARRRCLEHFEIHVVANEWRELLLQLAAD